MGGSSRLSQSEVLCNTKETSGDFRPVSPVSFSTNSLILPFRDKTKTKYDSYVDYFTITDTYVEFVPFGCTHGKFLRWTTLDGGLSVSAD